MRRYSVLATLVVAGLMATSCDRASSIAGPQALNTNPAFAIVFEKTNEQDVPWDEPVTNPCNGEEVLLSGSSHFLMHTWSDNSLGFHLSTSVTSKGTGLAPLSGDTYKASGETNYDAMVPDPTATSRFEHQVVAIGPKQADNFVIHFGAKITFAATGMPTATYDHITTKCTG
jgi:hypothetical protein